MVSAVLGRLSTRLTTDFVSNTYFNTNFSKFDSGSDGLKLL